MTAGTGAAKTFEAWLCESERFRHEPTLPLLPFSICTPILPMRHVRIRFANVGVTILLAICLLDRYLNLNVGEGSSRNHGLFSKRSG